MKLRLMAQTCAVGLLITTAVLLVACHPLINPLDPASPRYDGTPEEPPKIPTLPDIVAWYAYAEHGSTDIGNQWIGLPIPEDGSYTESRLEMNLCVEFAKEVSWEILDDCYLYVYVNYAGDDNSRQNPPFVDFHPSIWTADFLPNHNNRFADLGVWLPEPAGTRFLVRLYGPNGRMVSERHLAWLVGDVISDGVVEETTDEYTVDTLRYAVASLNNPLTVRADIESNGFVEDNDLWFFDNWPLNGNTVLDVERPTPP
jgi:hypothetical protein